MNFIKNLIAKVKEFFAKKPKPGKLETTFDYARPTLRGYRLARTGKHRNNRRNRTIVRIPPPIRPGSYAYQDKIMGALLRGEFAEARELIKNVEVGGMPRRIREFAKTSINTDALYSS